MGMTNPDCRFFRRIACAHPARARSWLYPLSWFGLRRPACRLIIDPWSTCALREAAVTSRPAPGPFNPLRRAGE